MPEHAPGAAPGHRLRYDGRLGDLYRIFFLNLLLTVLTLGIWRFWARTRLRRHVWQHLSLDGQRLEYTGTGGELFRGFLLALLHLVHDAAEFADVDADILPHLRHVRAQVIDLVAGFIK